MSRRALDLWFGKHVQAAPGTELLDTEPAPGTAGKVSEGRRWFSYEWWFGHHLDRDSSGRWADDGRKPAKKAPAHDDGAAGRAIYGDAPAMSLRELRADRAARAARAGATVKKSRNVARDQGRREYAEYLEGRERAAEQFVNGGHAITPEGVRRGVTVGSFFHPDSNKRRTSMKYAGGELRAYLGHGDTATMDGAGGPLMSFATWQQQTRQRA